MIRSSRDFEDVKLALNERTNWSIELASIFPPIITRSLTLLYSSEAVSRASLVLFAIYNTDDVIVFILLTGGVCLYPVPSILGHGRKHARALWSAPANNDKGT
ncbi:hypothetical protein JVT61DRAFT_2827 [Boletus reticuloceps]|uniref:Uncharacterized protein n=1 Tax=Boletus reticuloceps TaxID=495285 RepID=A0A8I3AAR9_9AGAM|nr:hypothetical protein JVT61DRAFT_2827 [Boletus reticuloceps]